MAEPGNIYYTDMLEVLRAAGVEIGENQYTKGWQTRARASGGYAYPPLGIMWHHTASNTVIENDLAYVTRYAEFRPVGNGLIDRRGVFWPVAAGASNTAGKGGPVQFSRGLSGVDQGNATMFHFEVCNSGSQPWPQVQIDAYFKASNAMNARFGNLPSDIVTHAKGAGDGYTTRKVDPSPAAMVAGPWKPRSVNNYGTWSMQDIKDECLRRAKVIVVPPKPPEPKPPEPEPKPPQPKPPSLDQLGEEEDMPFVVKKSNGETAVVYGSGKMTGLAGPDIKAFEAKFGTALPVVDATWEDFKSKGT